MTRGPTNPLAQNALEPQQFDLQVAQIDDANGIESGHVSGTFAGVEYHLASSFLVAMQVGVTVQGQRMLVIELPVKLQRIMHDEYPPLVPYQLQRRVLKIKTVPRDRCGEGIPFLIVVAIDAPQRRMKPAEHVEGFCLGDVAGVDDPLDAVAVKQLDDSANVFQIVVGVADNADFHDG